MPYGVCEELCQSGGRRTWAETDHTNWLERPIFVLVDFRAKRGRTGNLNRFLWDDGQRKCESIEETVGPSRPGSKRLEVIKWGTASQRRKKVCRKSLGGGFFFPRE